MDLAKREPQRGSKNRTNNNNIQPVRAKRSQETSSNKKIHDLTSASHQKAKQNYDLYLGRALAEAQSGNLVEAENFYQHADHYFRTLNNYTVPSH